MWLLSTTVMNRRDAVYGLKLFSPIAASYLLASSSLRANATKNHNVKSLRLQILRVLDHLFAFRQLHVSLLPVAPIPFALPPPAHLPVKICGAYGVDLHLEYLLHRFLDLRLGRAGGHFKHHRMLRLFHAQTLFRNNRAANNLI